MDRDEILEAIARAQSEIDMTDHGSTYGPIHPSVFLVMFDAAFEGYFGLTPEEAGKRSRDYHNAEDGPMPGTGADGEKTE